jgi:hypothetical protein
LERNGYQNCGFRNGVIFSPSATEYCPKRVTPFPISASEHVRGLQPNGQQIGPLKADAAHARDTIM